MNIFNNSHRTLLLASAARYHLDKYSPLRKRLLVWTIPHDYYKTNPFHMIEITWIDFNAARRRNGKKEIWPIVYNYT